MKKKSYLFPAILAIIALFLTFQAQACYPQDDDDFKHKTVLTIAGSDPSGGAGIQADLKTFSALKCYGMSAITALTAQNTKGLQGIHSLPGEFVKSQMQSVFDDIDVNAIKVGMLERKDIIEAVASSLSALSNHTPIIIDPVMYSKSGDKLLQDDAINTLRERLLPLATVLTPNVHEAACLANVTIAHRKDMEGVARILLEMGPKSVIIKGGALEDTQYRHHDCLVMRGDPETHWLTANYVETNNLHGAGCTFSAAIASYMAQGNDILTASVRAKEYVSGAIREGARYRLGTGKGPVNHFYTLWPEQNFTQAVWLEAKNIYTSIKQHKFIKELSKRLLPADKFDFYLEQDYLFLKDRSVVFSILSEKAPNVELAHYLNDQSQKSLEAANGVFEKYEHIKYKDSSISIERLEKNDSCKEYTQDMLTTASRSFKEGLVFLLPCSLIYQKIGEYIKHLPFSEEAGSSHSPQRYNLWIDSYSNNARRNRVEHFINIINAIAFNSSYEENLSLKNAFHKAAQHEFNFWDSTYNLSK